MSVTFSRSEIRFEEIPCRFCGEDWAAFPEGNGRGGKCDKFCRGVEKRALSPEANFSNSSTRDLLKLLGLPVNRDLWGEVEAGELLRRIIRAINSPRQRAGLVREASFTPGGHGLQPIAQPNGVIKLQRIGAGVFDGGNTDERTMMRLQALMEVALDAQEAGEMVVWG